MNELKPGGNCMTVGGASSKDLLTATASEDTMRAREKATPSKRIIRTVPLTEARRENWYAAPLSFAQERLWFLDQLEPDSPLHNMLSVARLTGVLDGAALEQSFGAIIARHETLRTRFICSEGEPLQLIDEGIKFTLPLKDLTKRDKVECQVELERLIQ